MAELIFKAAAYKIGAGFEGLQHSRFWAYRTAVSRILRDRPRWNLLFIRVIRAIRGCSQFIPKAYATRLHAFAALRLDP